MQLDDFNGEAMEEAVAALQRRVGGLGCGWFSVGKGGVCARLSCLFPEPLIDRLID